MTQSTLREKTANGLYWGSISSSLQQILSIGFSILIARILTQEDYGLIGVLSIFTAIASTIQEGGFTAGLINRKKIVHEDYNAVFWFTFGMAASIYLLFFFSAPWIAAFYKAPELKNLSRILFLGFLSGSLGIAPNALLQKELKVKERTIVDICSVIVSLSIGLALALLGYGYWGLVSQTVAYSVCGTILRWHYSSWRPNFQFNFQPLKEMFPFSIRLMLNGLFNQINSNIPSVFLGRFYTKSEVGDYTQGYKWASLSSFFINNIIQGIAQPVLVEANYNPNYQQKVFRKLLRFIAFISFPSMLGLALATPELIVILITDKWLASIQIMQLVCIWGAFLPVSTLYIQLIIAHGKSNICLGNTIVLGLLQTGILICIHSLGILPMVTAFLSVNFLWLGVWHYWGKKLISLRTRDVLKDILPYLAITLACLFTAWIVTKNIGNIYWLFVSKTALFAALYIFIMKVSRSVIFQESMDYLMNSIRKKR
ncbi:MAG: lipopolysaccharide biosynthesis protein [Candidatus Azobacteroides sp.]|nr:lipopolysaccharide biosynthesis protein [Candidatus Azobacteroides sp.]